LARSFDHVDGSNIAWSDWPTIAEEEIVPHYLNSDPRWERYLKFSIHYGSIAENFRILYANGGYSGPIVSEYPSGSTYAGGVFTDKHGLKITFFPNPKVEYPDGRTIYFDNITRSVWNNFGYAIKAVNSQPNSGPGYGFGPINLQALNLATDYCNITTNSLCTNVTEERKALYEVVQDNNGAIPFAGRVELTDASGGKTTIRNQLFSGFRYRPIPGYWGCSVPPVDHRPFPVGLTTPGSTVETRTFQYVAQFTPATLVCGLALDDIRVGSVTKDGVTAQIEATRYSPGETYGSYGGVSWFYVRSLINGQEISYSKSFKLGEFWGQSRIAMNEFKDELGRTTYYGWDSLWRIRSATAPEGNGITNNFDARNNIESIVQSAKTNSGLTSLSESYTYASSCSAATQARCNKPLSHTDAKGNLTEYSYNSYGQVLTETKPAPAEGAPRPTISNTYMMRTAYIRDSAGSPVAAGPPISLLTRSSTCMSLATCAGTNDEVVTEYDYGPITGFNNLLLRGTTVTAANGQGQLQTLRTCYLYNYFGEKIAETQPAAGLTSCP
jgi:YD repeat-containing protein